MIRRILGIDVNSTTSTSPGSITVEFHFQPPRAWWKRALLWLLRRRARRGKSYLTAEAYPALAKIWDNDVDSIYDEL